LFTENAINTKVGGTGRGTRIIKDAIDQLSVKVDAEKKWRGTWICDLLRRSPKWNRLGERNAEI